MDAMSTDVDLTLALSSYLCAHAGTPVQVGGLRRISDGWESDVYAFDAPEWKTDGRILRLYFGANAADKALHEYRTLKLLGQAGYPVPHVDLVEPSSDAVGRAFLIMERVEGISLGKRLRDVNPAVRGQEMDRFCALLSQLHTLAWEHLPGAQDVPTLSIDGQLALWERLTAHYPLDAATLAIAWLRTASAQVSPQPMGLLHWDFHHENILVDAAGNAFVIDWTQFQASDVRFDLAWTLVLLASERDAETAEAVRTGYLAQRGWDEEKVAPELCFFEAAACAKRLLLVLISLGAGADALGMRPGAEAIMSSRLSRIAIVYRRWLELTQTPLPDVEKMLAGHL